LAQELSRRQEEGRIVRITFISDITPVPLTAGPLVLYGHFSRMSHHECLVVSGEIPEPDPVDRTWDVLRLERRAQAVSREVTMPLFEELRSVQILREAGARIDEFGPDVVLSVWSGEFLLPAYQYSRSRNTPLVLICHDDWESMHQRWPHCRAWARWRLGQIYRHASQRLCVSEGMATEFEQRYGAPGKVLYPLSGAREPKNAASPVQKKTHSIIFGYAGRIGPGECQILQTIADNLAEQTTGELRISSPSKGVYLDALFSHPAVRFLGFFFTPEDTREYFSNNVDVMLVVQDFDESQRTCMATNFPSKLVECAQWGRPVCIISPEYGSAARWAAKYPEATITVRSTAKRDLADALNAFRDFSSRKKLADRLANVAAEAFSSDKLHSILESSLEAA